MRLLGLVFSSFRRKRLRTLLTLLSIVAAFSLFGLLAAVRVAFQAGVQVAGADRLILTHKSSIVLPLPIRYLPRIERTDGVRDVAHATWFGGIYKDAKNFFAQLPVEPDRFLRIYPEYLLSDAERQAWLRVRTGAIAGRVAADQYGWSVGDRIPIQATIWTRADGEPSWEFDLVGIFDGAEKGTDTNQFFFRYDYFNESRGFGKDLVGWYIIRVANPDQAAAVAERIDAQFANSPFETKTSTEQAFLQGFANQIGNIGAIVQAIVTAVFFIILLVVGNTIAQGVRERTGELAVLKTLGFTHGEVLVLVLAESVALAMVGGGIGLALSFALVSGASEALVRFLPVFYIPPGAIGVGVGLMVSLGLAAGLIPAVQAMRLRIVDALRRV